METNIACRSRLRVALSLVSLSFNQNWSGQVKSSQIILYIKFWQNSVKQFSSYYMRAEGRTADIEQN